MGKKIYKEIEGKTLEELHNVELEILREIDRICKKHHIEYFLVGGTLLGAVRHGGFIPWDDDLDIGMFRGDYEKFIDIAIRELDDKYFIHCMKTDKHYWLPFIKVKKNNTTFIEQLTSGKDSIHDGIFVDIFPIDNTGANYNINRIKGLFIRNISDSYLVKEKKISLKEARHPVLCGILICLPKKCLVSLQYKFIKWYDKDDYAIGWVGVYHIKKELLKKEYVKPLIDIKFEDVTCKAFYKYKEYLKNIYGDYMKLPPVSERVNHGAVEISFKKGKDLISKDMVK